MYNTAYLQKAKDFKSATNEIFKAIDTVSIHVKNRGIWTIDRGGDNILIFKKFIKEDKKFVIRVKQNRNIIVIVLAIAYFTSIYVGKNLK